MQSPGRPFCFIQVTPVIGYHARCHNDRQRNNFIEIISLQWYKSLTALAKYKCGVIWKLRRLKSPTTRLIVQRLIQTNNIETVIIIGPLYRESSDKRWIPNTKGQCQRCGKCVHTITSLSTNERVWHYSTREAGMLQTKFERFQWLTTQRRWSPV